MVVVEMTPSLTRAASAARFLPEFGSLHTEVVGNALINTYMKFQNNARKGVQVAPILNFLGANKQPPCRLRVKSGHEFL